MLMSEPAAQPAAAGFVEQESLAETPDDFVSFGTASGTTYIGLSWTPGSSYTITQIAPKLYKVLSAVQTLTAYIYSDALTVPDTVLATSTNTVDASTLSTDTTGVYTNFQFSGLALTGSTRYHLVIGCSSVDASNFVRIRYLTVGGGSEFLDLDADGTSWGATTEATVQGTFKTYITA